MSTSKNMRIKTITELILTIFKFNLDNYSMENDSNILLKLKYNELRNKNY